MPTPFEVRCSACNSVLEVTERKLDSDGDLLIEVEGCEKCIEAAKEDGFKDGHDKGFDEGKEATE